MIRNDVKEIIPQEIKSDAYLGLGVFFKEALFIGIYWIIWFSIDGIVSPILKVPFYLFNIAVAIFLTRMTATNPEKRIFQVLSINYLANRNNKFYERELENEEEIY